MKKNVITLIMGVLAFNSTYAQSVPLPTADLYDTGVMRMYLGALSDRLTIQRMEHARLEREIQMKREEYINYVNQVVTANNNKEPNKVFFYSDIALGYDFTDCSGVLYMCRGNAYLMQKDLVNARAQYEVAYKTYNYYDAKQALDWVNKELGK